jgi:VanZ family protein
MPQSESQRSGRRTLGAWAVVIAWTLLISAFSGDAFSADSTSRFIRPLLRWLFPDALPEILNRLHAAVRQGAHAFEYGVLALLSFRALRLSTDSSPGRTFALALLLVLAVATADETHQALSQARTGSPWDVALDLAGGALALALLAALLRSPKLGRLFSAPRSSG